MTAATGGNGSSACAFAAAAELLITTRDRRVMYQAAIALSVGPLIQKVDMTIPLTLKSAIADHDTVIIQMILEEVKNQHKNKYKEYTNYDNLTKIIQETSGDLLYTHKDPNAATNAFINEIKLAIENCTEKNTTFARKLLDKSIHLVGTCRRNRKYSPKNDWGFIHIMSSPHYAQSNGLAESAVKSVKLIFKKAMDAGEDPYLAMLNFHATPRGSVHSPASTLMGHNL
ncbi:hypothetical protein JTB14_017623 [Gonioctena quinquepunctata]|nr:hypothetical protein JTB14_017623 [Gonioctena quinquepunctata]